MSQWFYAEGNRERRGPLPAENIVELFRSGRIAADTLVWREGAEHWQPLQAFAAELGLPDVSGPAVPVPPALPDLPAPPPPAVQHVHVAVPNPPPAAVRQGLSGCAIVGIIVAVVGVILLAVLAILAAIAYPQYREYTLRSKTSMVQAQLVALKGEVSAFASEHERCPVNGDAGFGSPESYEDGTIAEVRIGRFDGGHCGLEARLQAPGTPQLDSKAIWLDYDTQTATWKCRSDVADNYLPTDCRS